MANPGPLTRSSIKPRVLFPSSNDDGKADDVDETDEEAATDVEDNANPKDGANEIDHGPDVDMHQDPVTPPAKSIVTPPSPGGTIRTLRSRAKRDFAEYDTTPTAPATRTKTMSPFAGWQRKKQSPPSGTATPKRRDARNTSPGEPAAKRTRSNRATLPS